MTGHGAIAPKPPVFVQKQEKVTLEADKTSRLFAGRILSRRQSSAVKDSSGSGEDEMEFNVKPRTPLSVDNKPVRRSSVLK